MATKLLARAERASAQEQLRTLPRLAAASTTLALAMQILLEATTASEAPAGLIDPAAQELSLAQIWAEIEQVVPRHEVAGALSAILDLAPPSEEDTDVAWRTELVKRYATVRPFLPLLTEVIPFGAVAGGQAVLEAAQQLPQLMGRKKLRPEEVASELVAGSWKRLVHAPPAESPGLVDHRAYAFCVLEHLYRGLRRRDLFVHGSERWDDPRARLLNGEACERSKPDVLAALRLAEAAGGASGRARWGPGCGLPRGRLLPP
jgi:hypothetical protein